MKMSESNIENRALDSSPEEQSLDMRIAIYMSHHPHVEAVYLNKTLKTITRGKVAKSREKESIRVASFLQNQDIWCVEFISKDDALPKVDTRIKLNRQALPLEMRGGSDMIEVIKTEKKVIPSSTLNNYPLSSKKFCLGMYDFTQQADCKQWVTKTIKLFEKYGLTPTKLGDTGANASKGRKMLTFKRGIKRLEQYSYKGFDEISLVASPPYDEGDYDIDLGNASCSFDKTSHELAYILLDENLVGGISEETANKIYLEYYSLFKPKYSFCTTLEWWKGPDWYMRGYHYFVRGFTPDWPKGSMGEIDNWRAQYNGFIGKYTTGDFRDIYEINYIGPEHLNIGIGDGRQLRDVIGKEPGWGSIKQLAEGVYSWHLTTEEAQVLRQKLAPTGRILALKKPGS
jgi:hypothetical protein